MSGSSGIDSLRAVRVQALKPTDGSPWERPRVRTPHGMPSVGLNEAALEVQSRHRHAALVGTADRVFVARVDVAEHAHARIAIEHEAEAVVRVSAAVTDD